MKYGKELEILALVLQFVSFWFAAPEIVGEKILRKVEAGLLNGIKIVVGIGVGILFLLAIYWTYASGRVVGRWLAEQAQQSPGLVYGTMSLIVGAILLLIFFRKRLMAATRGFDDTTYKRVIKPFFDLLIKKEELRLRSLALGAILFTVGFALQIFLIFARD